MIITIQIPNQIKRGKRYYQHYQIGIIVSQGKQNRTWNCNRFCNEIHITITTIECTSEFYMIFPKCGKEWHPNISEYKHNIRDMMEMDTTLCIFF